MSRRIGFLLLATVVLLAALVVYQGQVLTQQGNELRAWMTHCTLHP